MTDARPNRTNATLSRTVGGQLNGLIGKKKMLAITQPIQPIVTKRSQAGTKRPLGKIKQKINAPPVLHASSVLTGARQAGSSRIKVLIVGE